MRRAFLVILLVSTKSILQAQVKTTANEQQVWLGYFNQTRLSDKLGLWADFHLRTKEDFGKELSQAIARVAVTYYLNDATKVSAGFASVNHFPADAHPKISQPEYRPWQQIQWHTKYVRTRLMQWIRLEERYRRKIYNDSTLAKGYNFNFRARYNMLYEIPISKQGNGLMQFPLFLTMRSISTLVSR